MRYVLATDGSDPSLKAARFFARNFCPGPDDDVFVVYVFPLPADRQLYDEIMPLPTDAADERIVRISEPILTETKALLGELETRVEDVVLLGDPAKEIIVFATTMNADLVVAGTHGRSLARELYLGSVSSALAHLAPCSVLTVRGSKPL